MADDSERKELPSCARTLPAPTDMPDTPPATTKPQLTTLINDVAGSLRSTPSVM